MNNTSNLSLFQTDKNEDEFPKNNYIQKINNLKEEIINYLQNNLNSGNEKNIDLNSNQFMNNFNDYISKEFYFIEHYCFNELLQRKKYESIIQRLEKINILLSILNNINHNDINSFITFIQTKLKNKFFIENYLIQYPILINNNLFLQLKDKINIDYLYENLNEKKIKDYIKDNIKINSIYIKNNAIYNNKKDLIINNCSNLKKIKIENLEENEIMNILDNNFAQCNILFINNCKITNFDLTKFKELNEFTFKNSIFKFENLNFSNIQNLNLDNTGLIDLSFNKIIVQFSKINPITLKIVSVMNNNLTNLNIITEKVVLSVLKKLDELDLENNKIFDINPELISKEGIKFCNLTQNNFSFINDFNLESKIKDFEKNKNSNYFSVIILSKNIFLMRNEDKNLYIDYLIKTIKQCNYGFKKICFDYLFDKSNLNLLKEINLNSFQLTLKTLDLSHCSLNDSFIIELLSTNMILSNLKDLIICSNEITNKFFSYFNEKLVIIFPKLKNIDLSENQISFVQKEEFLSLISFINLSLSIQKLIFKNTPFEKDICSYLKKVLGKLYKERKKENNKENNIPIKFNLTDFGVQHLLKDENVIQKNDFKIHISNLIKGKYYLKIKKHLNNLFNYLTLE